MRRAIGDNLRVFNGTDGEWLCRITAARKREVMVELIEQLRPQESEPDIMLAFAPIKQDRLHGIIEKATELGVSAIIPVITARTISSRINQEKCLRYAEEAAEQCERLAVPIMHEAKTLSSLLAGWDSTRTMIFCDESGGGIPIARFLMDKKPGRYALLTGPEGGFTHEELEHLRKLPYVGAVGLGPRILRADTAIIAALACIGAHVGDWQKAPRFQGE